MFRWLANLWGTTPTRPGRGRVVRVVRGRYDAASTSDENRRHWANADGLSANKANSAELRRVLRNRARYETANDSYAKGIVLTLANDVVGTGPRLQLLTEDGEANTRIEREFTAWAKAVGLPEKLRTLRMARATDGEAFAVLTSNPRLATPVQLDLRLVEADQVTTPDLRLDMPVDGIVFDAAGNPVEYHVLRDHPGDGYRAVREYDRVPAAAMLHWFRCDRPGQARGVPDILPALPLFAQLRRFTLAVIAAAETAADFAGILYTDAPASGESDAAEPFEPIELEKRALVTMPGGWKMSQLQAEQPSTGYAEFKHEILNEIARCLNMPFKVGDRKTRFWTTMGLASRGCAQASAFPGVAQDHRVLAVLAVAAADDQQVGVRSPFPQRFPQLRDHLANTLASLPQFGGRYAQVGVRFHAIDGSLHLAQRASPADRRCQQPEEPADLRVVPQVNPRPHAPGDAVVVRVAANPSVILRSWVSALGLLVVLRRRRLGLRQAQPDLLAVGPGDGPAVNLAQRQRPRLLFDDAGQVLPIFPRAARRLETPGREIGLRRLERLLNLVGQFRKGPFSFGLQLFESRRGMPLQDGEHAAQRRQGLAERCACRLDALGKHPQLDQSLPGFWVVGAGLQIGLTRSDLSLLAVVGHGRDTHSTEEARNRVILRPRRRA